MADWGLIGGLAEGLNRGLQSYQDTSRYRDEQALKRRQQQTEDERFKTKLQTEGWDTDPVSGELKRSNVWQEEKKAERDAKREDMRLEAELKKKEIDPLQAQKTQAEINKLNAEARKAARDPIAGSQNAGLLPGASGGGKMLPPAQILAVQQGSQIPQMLQDIKGTLANSKEIFGPVAGRIAGANPYNEKASTADAQLRASSQAFGRLMEGGVLRKEDEEKYRKMFPQLSDTPEVAANKLAIVERLLIQKQEADIGALQASGYDTSGINLPGSAPDVPGILTKRPEGLIKEAKAAPKKAAEEMTDAELDAYEKELLKKVGARGGR